MQLTERTQIILGETVASLRSQGEETKALMLTALAMGEDSHADELAGIQCNHDANGVLTPEEEHARNNLGMYLHRDHVDDLKYRIVSGKTFD